MSCHCRCVKLWYDSDDLGKCRADQHYCLCGRNNKAQSEECRSNNHECTCWCDEPYKCQAAVHSCSCYRNGPEFCIMLVSFHDCVCCSNHVYCLATKIPHACRCEPPCKYNLRHRNPVTPPADAEVKSSGKE